MVAQLLQHKVRYIGATPDWMNMMARSTRPMVMK
jgi:hypothetical protein